MNQSTEYRATDDRSMLISLNSALGRKGGIESIHKELSAALRKHEGNPEQLEVITRALDFTRMALVAIDLLIESTVAKDNAVEAMKHMDYFRSYLEGRKHLHADSINAMKAICG